jgi:pimeloyl-[acyl-carrier protein] methyl ester esterase
MTAPTTWVLLPGLDGTGTLFEPMLRSIPPEILAVIVSYPLRSPSTASELIDIIWAALPEQQDYIIVAESFSGPLALRVAGERPRGMRALILCASFAEAPMAARLYPLFSLTIPILKSLRIPAWLMRWCLVGKTSVELLEKIRFAIDLLTAEALASRFKVLREFKKTFAPLTLDLPVLYIRPVQDRLVRQRDIDLLKDRYPELEVQEIESPHLVLQCRAKEAVILVSDFVLRRITNGESETG